MRLLPIILLLVGCINNQSQIAQNISQDNLKRLIVLRDITQKSRKIVIDAYTSIFEEVRPLLREAQLKLAPENSYLINQGFQVDKKIYLDNLDKIHNLYETILDQIDILILEQRGLNEQ